MQSLPSEILNLITRYLNLQEYFKFYGTSKQIAFRLPKEPKLYQDPNLSVEDFDNLMEKACQTGNSKFVKHLLKDLRFTPKSYALIDSSFLGHLEIVELLLNDSRVDPSYNYNEAIRVASDRGHLEIVKLLMNDSRVDPSDYDNSAIREASKYGHLEIVKLLMNDSRVDPSACDTEVIRAASEFGHFEIVELLMKDPRVKHFK